MTIGKLLYRGQVGFWMVPFSLQNRLWREKITQPQIAFEWFTPSGAFPTGSLFIKNYANRPFTVPPDAIIEDPLGRTYRLIEPRGYLISPHSQTELPIRGEQKETLTYTGSARFRPFTPGGSFDEDHAEGNLLNVPPEATVVQGWAIDLGEETEGSLVQLFLNVSGGSKVGNTAMVAYNTQPLEWMFSAQESLSGFNIMTERLSGYLYHRVNLRVKLRFPEPKMIRMRTGLVRVSFSGLEQEAVEA